MITLDLFNLNKNKTGEGEGREVDISDAVSGYVAKDASSIISKETEIVKKEMEQREKESLENQILYETEEEPGEYQKNLPFEVGNTLMGEDYPPINSDDDSFEGGGGMNVQYEIQYENNSEDEKKNEYPEIEINGGYSPMHLKDLFASMAEEGNLFKDVKFI